MSAVASAPLDADFDGVFDPFTPLSADGIFGRIEKITVRKLFAVRVAATVLVQGVDEFLARSLWTLGERRIAAHASSLFPLFVLFVNFPDSPRDAEAFAICRFPPASLQPPSVVLHHHGVVFENVE